MSKYYLTNALKNSTAKTISVTTGSESYSAGSDSRRGAAEQFRTRISPSGEYILRMGRARTVSDTAYFSIHQSQSSIPGGFDFSHPTSSDSIVFTSPWEAAASQQNIARPYGMWISENEFAIGLMTNYQALSGSNTLSGAGWPSGDFSGPTGVFAIMSGSDSTWNVTFWNTGSTDAGSADDGDTQPHHYRLASAMGINNRYTSAETNRIAIHSNGMYSNASNYMDESITVFAKTSGSWGFHSQFDLANGRTASRIEWLDDDQDHMGIIWTPDGSGVGGLSIYEPSQDGSNSNIKYAEAAYSDNYDHLAVVWDPYNKKTHILAGELMGTINSGSNWISKIGSDNAYLAAGTVDELLDFGGELVDKSYTTPMGCDLAYWRFRSGSTALMFPWAQTAPGRASALSFIESGSNGWYMPFNGYNSHDRPVWYPENAPGLVLQGGDEIATPHNAVSTGYSTRYFHVHATRNNTGPADSWMWNTDKGASGELIYTAEGYDTGTDSVTGRNIFYRLNAYDGVTPDELAPLASKGTGNTSYEISSSFDSLSWELVTAPQNDYVTNYTQGARGGKFSPDGTRVAQGTLIGGEASEKTYRYGVDLYKSGSSGWEWETFLSASFSVTPTEVAWASNNELWAAFGSTSANNKPQKWVSSSVGGWQATSSLAYGTENEEAAYGDNYISRYNRLLFNKDRTAVVLWVQQSVETLSHGNNYPAFGIAVSSSDGSAWPISVYYQSGYEVYGSFQWIDDATNAEQDYRLIASTDEKNVLVYNVLTSSGVIRGDQYNRTHGQQKLIMEVDPDSEANMNLFLYHSASDSLIYDYGLGNQNDDNVALMTTAVNPLGEKYNTGSSNSSYHGYNERLQTVQSFIPYDNTSVSLVASNENNAGLFADQDFLLASSSANNGGYFASSGTYAYYDRPSKRFAQLFDPSTQDRFLYAAGYEDANSGFSLNVVEKGANGWKRRKLFELTGDTKEDNWNSSPNRFGYDISIRGDLLIPATGSITGFQIARVSGMGTQENPALESTVTQTVGTAGGTVKAGGTEGTPTVTLTFPSNALAGDTSIGVDLTQENDPKTIGLGAAGVAGADIYSNRISLTPHGTTFASAVTVQFSLHGDGAGACPTNLEIWKRQNDSGIWYKVPNNLWSCSSGTITISTTSFSEYMAIGGNNMARTKISNVQLSKLTESDKVLAEAINISGSLLAGEVSSVVAGDYFLIQQAAGGTARPVSASVMQDFFSKSDVHASVANADQKILFASGSGNGVSVAVDDGTGLTFNASTNLLKAGALTVANTISGSVIESAGVITAGGTITAVGSFIIGSADLSEADMEKIDGITNGAGAANKALVLDAGGDIVSGLRNLSASGGIVAGLVSGSGVGSFASLDIDSGIVAGTSVTAGTSFVIGSADLNETDLEKLDGITNGAGAANKALVLDAGGDIVSGLRNLSASGGIVAGLVSGSGVGSFASLDIDSGIVAGTSVTAGTSFIIGSADLNETDLEKLDGITNGAGAANKALVLDAGADIVSGLRNLSASGGLVAATVSGSGAVTGASFAADGAAVLGGSVTAGTSFIIGSADLNETDLEKLDGITNGTAAASKAVVLDANKNVGTLNSLTASGVSVTELAATNATIAGNLTVQGTTTTVDSEHLTVKDTIVTLGSSSNGASPGIGDRGFVFEVTGSQKAFFWDQSATEFALAQVPVGQYAHTGSGDINIDSYLDLSVGAVSGSGAGSFASLDIDGVITAGGSVTAGTSFVIGSADLNETDLEKLDGITNGTGAASKAVVLDANKNITGINSITSSFSGDGSGLTGVGAQVTEASSADAVKMQIPFTTGSAAAGSFFIHSGSLGYTPSTNTLFVSHIEATGSSEDLIIGASATGDSGGMYAHLDKSAARLKVHNASGNTLAGLELQYSNATYGSLVLANYSSGEADVKLHSPGKVILSGSSVVASGSLLPSVDDTHDLGSSTFAWKDLYLEGDIKLTDAGTIQTDAGALTISGNAGVSVTSAATFSGKLSGSNGIDVTGHAEFNSTLNVDGALTAGSITADDTISGSIVAAAGAITAGGSVTAGTSFIIGSADLNETDLEKLDGITNGAGAANKALVLDAGGDIVSGLRNLSASGGVVAATVSGSGQGSFENLSLGGGTSTVSNAGVASFGGTVTAVGSFIIGSADLNEADLEKLDGITNGTAAASKAVVLDASLNATGVNALTASGLKASTALDAAGTIHLHAASASVAVASDFMYFKEADGTNEVKQQTVAGFLSASTGAGLQITNGVFSVVSVTDIATSASKNSILSADLVTASLSTDPLTGSIQVYLNGLLQTPSGSVNTGQEGEAATTALFDYEVLGAPTAFRVEFVSAIDDDDVVQVKYIKR